MSYREIEIGGIYHIYNRGVEKRNIFLDNEDRSIFLHHLFVLNNTKRIHNLSRDRNIQIKEKEDLVEILGFCLMDNHYHILIKETKKGGVSKFMQKLGTGYTMFFNKKNKRSGSLFQGKYKIKKIKTDEQFNYILDYIHMNPIKNYEGGPTSLIKNLQKYKWSSLLDYLGIENFPSIINTDLYFDYFNGYDGYLKHLSKTILFKKEIEKKNFIEDVLID